MRTQTSVTKPESKGRAKTHQKEENEIEGLDYL
jgi:hypothetical protein